MKLKEVVSAYINNFPKIRFDTIDAINCDINGCKLSVFGRMIILSRNETINLCKAHQAVLTEIMRTIEANSQLEEGL